MKRHAALRTTKKYISIVQQFIHHYLLHIISIGLLLVGGFALWATTLELPPLNSADNIQISESTKIYDKTGKVVLFDVHTDFRRTIVTADEMSPFIRKAAVAIEDENFYSHNGIKISSIIRAMLNSALNLGFTQGGSTITQQVIKNALLTREKSITRKVKEWILALKLEKIMSKEDILTLYLNTIPYGGNIYGIEEASRVYFSKQAKDLTLAEAAYLAALPQAPTYYSPYGSHRKELDSRKNLVLAQMNKNGFITQQEYKDTLSEEVTFAPATNSSIKAPHFVMYVREKLEELFKDQSIEEGGYKVITTLDYDLQATAEEIVKRKALSNTTEFNASNAAMVAIEPNTGSILTMVGSRDYFDKEIDGNFNIATALRQPGSSFKPVVYAAAFEKGYQPETALFDVPTEFSTSCRPTDPTTCYNPENYDHLFRGPMNLRNALAQSINIPAVKLLYLVGIDNAINLAEKMGITTLNDPRRYGLSLVLGGGEVKLLDMVDAYATFAADGMHYAPRAILEIQDNNGKVIYKAPEPQGTQALSNDSARKISSILSDNTARAPLYGTNSQLHFPGKTVAAKTGTTNDYRDAWIIGYTPYIAVGTWAGNNDNSSMEKKISGLIVAPMWNEFMQKVLANHNNEPFLAPSPLPDDIDPIIAGNWQVAGAHTLLPKNNPQHDLWEEGIQEWLRTSGSDLINTQPASTTDSTTSSWSVTITAPSSHTEYNPAAQIPVVLSINGGITPERADVYLNNTFVGSFNKAPFVFSLTPSDVKNLKKKNTLKVSVYDQTGTRKDTESVLNIIQ